MVVGKSKYFIRGGTRLSDGARAHKIAPDQTNDRRVQFIVAIIRRSDAAVWRTSSASDASGDIFK